MERKQSKSNTHGFAVSFSVLILVSVLMLGLALTFTQPAVAAGTDLWLAEAGGAGYVLSPGSVYGAVPITGQIGNALQFDGIDDYVSVPDMDSLELTTAFTFAAWIKPGASHNGNSGTILTKNKTDNHSYYWAIGGGVVDSNKKLAVYLGGTSPKGWQYSSSDLPVDAWVHIATTFDGSTIKHYIDGSLDATISGISGTILTNTQPLTIGQRMDYLDVKYQFNGAIDEVIIRNEVLSESEINGIYQDGLSGTGFCTDGDGVCAWTGGVPTGDIYYTGGNVGIGTSNPASKLEVNGIIHSTGGGIKFPDGTVQTTASDAAGTSDGHSLDAADGTPVDALYVDNEGNVGIGTVNPYAKLEVTGIVRSTSGGFQFPDGTIQTTAAYTSVGMEPDYDSGWFSGISSWAVFTKVHGLGTPPRMVVIQARHNPTGSIIFLSPQYAYGYTEYGGLACVQVDNTNIKVKASLDRIGTYLDDTDNRYNFNFSDASLRIYAWK